MHRFNAFAPATTARERGMNNVPYPGDTEISVVIAVEGYADRIPVMLLHIEQQTFPASRMEVVIGDALHDTAVLEAVRNYGVGAPMRTRAVRARVPGVLAALNEAIRAAQGRLVLLLDEDLLASPRLVELHCAAHADAGAGHCTIGAVRPHPQLGEEALTAWFMSGAQQLGAGREALDYLDWRRSNALYERAAMLDAGGFDELYGAPQFADADLAYRLQHAGVTATYLPEAVAYIAYASYFTKELERHYHKGRGLRRLFEITRDAAILRRYPVPRGYLRRALDWLFIPFYIRACTTADADTRILGHVYRRVFLSQRGRGWRAAARSRAR